jgi:hypothetical protein
MRQAIQQIKKKRDNPISLAFSVNDGIFIISISFLTDNATFRLAVKTIAVNYFPKVVSQIPVMIKALDKDFMTGEKGYKKD